MRKTRIFLFFLLLSSIGAALLFLGGSSKIELAPEQVRYVQTLPLEHEIIRLVNEKRAEAGLEPLRENQQASQVALRKVIEMMEYDYFEHESPVTGDIPRQFEAFGQIVLGVNSSAIGENIARSDGYPVEEITADFLMEQWMDSTPHRENILNPGYTAMGAAVCYSEGRMLAAQEFLTEKEIQSP